MTGHRFLAYRRLLLRCAPGKQQQCRPPLRPLARFLQQQAAEAEFSWREGRSTYEAGVAGPELSEL